MKRHTKELRARGRRRPGRPTAAKSEGINSQSIISVAYRMARTMPLQGLSIVRVAKQMGITPALIHYYIRGRNGLTSCIMNAFYRELLQNWPEETGVWETDIVNAAKAFYEHLVRYAGVSSYVVQNNRFRIFQLTSEGEEDYGILFLEKFTSCVRAVGLSAERTGVYAHIMLELIMSAAHGAVSHRYPSDHRKFIEEKAAQLDPERFPSIAFTRNSQVSLRAYDAFLEGCNLMLLGLQRERVGLLAATRKSRAKKLEAPGRIATSS